MKQDLELITALKSGESRALSLLYDKYSGAIYSVIIRMCREEDLAQNLLQDTFLKAWEKADQYDETKGRFYTWLYRIARNTVLNALRSNNDFIQNEDLSVYESKGSSDDELDLDMLKGSLSSLEPHHRQAIELVYYKGMTHRDAHTVMNVPLGTFKSYVRQALKKLKAYYGNG